MSTKSLKNLNNMSKIKELDLIAQGVADHMKELLYDTVEWQIADQPLDGDDYKEMQSYVMDKAIEKMAMQLPGSSRIKISYKQNTIISG
jgi:hypothetical protein